MNNDRTDISKRSALPSNSRSSNASTKKALVLGGTGAMGVYLVPELVSLGYHVRVISLDDAVSDNPMISFTKADAHNNGYLKDLLKEKFDVIVDFMIYTTEQFRKGHDILLQNTAHYIFLSTYRVYSGSSPVTEKTLRLLDSSDDKEFLATEDYALTKARQEDILMNSAFNNWTIVRPAITYSKLRYQLVTLEAPVVVARALKGLPVVLPQEALSVPATMSWAGDVAKMISRLIFNEAAYRECFTAATAEHHTWGEIAQYYKEIIGLTYMEASTEDYQKTLGSSKGAEYQLAYDRMFPRIIDNTKILTATGMAQADLMPLRHGLERELSHLPNNMVWPKADAVWAAMDEYIQKVK